MSHPVSRMNDDELIVSSSIFQSHLRSIRLLFIFPVVASIDANYLQVDLLSYEYFTSFVICFEHFTFTKTSIICKNLLFSTAVCRDTFIILSRPLREQVR